MTPDTLAAIVARDAACGRSPLPDSAFPQYQALADRRALLALLRETRDALGRLVAAWDDGITTDPDNWRAADREIAALSQSRDTLKPLAALDTETPV